MEKATRKVLIVDRFNYVHTPKKQVWRKSITQPNQSMSVREILTKHTQGINMEGKFAEFHSENPETQLGIDPRRLDYAEIQELQEKNMENMTNLAKEEKKRQIANKQAKEAKENERIEAAAKKLMEQSKKDSTNIT